MQDNALFQVAVKAFIVREGKLLLLKEAEGLRWEIPGGRIQLDELEVPLTKIMQREVAEELGTNFIIEPIEIITQWIRINTAPRYPIFLNGFYCKWISGDIALSDEHSEAAWVTEHESFNRELANGYENALKAFWKFHTHV